MGSYVTTFITAFVLVLAATPLAIRLANKWGVMDYPGDRRIHKVPVPRLGGAAIFLAFWLAILINFGVSGVDSFNGKMIFGFFLGSLIIFAVGVVDDIKGIRPLFKLLWQVLAAVILIFFGLQEPTISLPFLGQIDLGIFSYPFAVFWITGMVNTVNVSDGMDGLAAGVCFFASLVLCWSASRIDRPEAALIMLALAGVSLGFLFYNYHPAKIFMGDSGSMFLGYMMGAVSIWALLKTSAILGLVFPLLVLAMPLTDLLFAIIRRSRRGVPIARADRGHLHHRLLDAGLTQRQAVLVLYGISFSFGLAAIFSIYDLWYISLLLVVINFALILRIIFRKFNLRQPMWKRKYYAKNREGSK